MNLSVVIPCFNEIKNIPNLQTSLIPVLEKMARDVEVELVIVNDGSTDRTLQCLNETLGDFKDFPIIITNKTTNLGLGAALRTGFLIARGETVVTTDCDGTFDFNLIPLLLSQMTPGVDIVIASQYHPQGKVFGVPRHRTFLSKGCSAIYRLLVTNDIYTYTSLFRAYRREVISKVQFMSDGFLSVTELLVRALLAGYHVAECPTLLTARASGRSKMRLGRTILAHLGFQVRVLLHRLAIKRLYP